MSDLRNVNEKYYKLEKKIEKLVNSQNRMKELEDRVLMISQENNIVKNIAEVVKPKRKMWKNERGLKFWLIFFECYSFSLSILRWLKK